MESDPLKRFSDRVEFYIRSRPNYPPALLEFMHDTVGLRPDHVVADVGSGTGILSRMLLDNGNSVFAVEPNEPMRRAAEQILAEHAGFHSVAGSAEATGLQPASVDFITAGQAFHWFDPERSRAEFRRILRGGRSGGWVVLAWNDRRLDRPPFAVGYENLVRRYNTDLDKINHRNVSRDDSDALVRFFGSTDSFSSVTFENPQAHDWQGVRARLLSSSYMPASGDPRSVAMLEELRAIFEEHQRSGVVHLEYDTRVYYGRLSVRAGS